MAITGAMSTFSAKGVQINYVSHLSHNESIATYSGNKLLDSVTENTIEREVFSTKDEWILHYLFPNMRNGGARKKTTDKGQHFLVYRWFENNSTCGRRNILSEYKSQGMDIKEN